MKYEEMKRMRNSSKLKYTVSFSGMPNFFPKVFIFSQCFSGA